VGRKGGNRVEEGSENETESARLTTRPKKRQNSAHVQQQLIASSLGGSEEIRYFFLGYRGAFSAQNQKNS